MFSTDALRCLLRGRETFARGGDEQRRWLFPALDRHDGAFGAPLPPPFGRVRTHRHKDSWVT